ncbi:Glutamate synthase, central-N domain protein, partial [mine drainage metagenome]
ASEAGVVDVPAREVLELGRLHPGQMLAVDTREGLLLRDQEIKRAVAARGPWAAWERGRVLSLHTAEDGEEVVELPAPSLGDLAAQHRCFGYTEEELRTVLAPAATGGHEAVASMGNDAALAALSRRSRLLFDYFSQGFAQVTNPPIDSLRERRVMSLR